MSEMCLSKYTSLKRSYCHKMEMKMIMMKKKRREKLNNRGKIFKKRRICRNGHKMFKKHRKTQKKNKMILKKEQVNQMRFGLIC